jgi:hypothetical protein
MIFTAANKSAAINYLLLYVYINYIALIGSLLRRQCRCRLAFLTSISLTSILGKLMESIIADTIVSYLEENNITGNTQHETRHHRLYLTNLVTAIFPQNSGNSRYKISVGHNLP